MTEKQEAIEYLKPPKQAHSGEARGGTVVIYRLKLMTVEEIAAHGLTQYTKEGEGNAENE